MAKKDTKTLYLIINIFAFLSCWAAAMGFISWFDAPIYIIVVFATVAGYLQGALREIVNFVIGVGFLLLSWFSATWLTDTLGFGFFMPKLHYAYIVWFVCISIVSIVLAKKIVNFIVRKCHNQNWLKQISFRLGLPVGLAKGLMICFILLGMIHYSGFLVSNFPNQVNQSIFLKNFNSIENDHRILANIDVIDSRNYIYDTENRWKLYNVVGQLYPYQYQTQKAALSILLPIIFEHNHLHNFLKTEKGEKLIAILKKDPSIEGMWKNNVNNIKDLRKNNHTPHKILVFLYQTNIQKILQTQQVKEFLIGLSSKN